MRKIAKFVEMSLNGKIILGVDPGTGIMGFGILEIGSNKPVIIDYGVLKMDKLDNHTEKLKHIFTEITKLIQTFKPSALAIEAPFYGKNVQSMLKLGRAQGVAIAAAIAQGLEVYEYAPRKIKQSITGNGNASKEQVAAMLQNILVFKTKPEYLDSTDAIAVALCHHFQGNKTKVNNSGKGWAAFIKANPNRKIGL